MEKINLELQANTKEAEKNIERLNKKVKDTGKTARKTGKEISAAMQIGNEAARGLDRYTGGLASKLVAVGKAAKLSGKAMKTALISTGIGALVVALGLVVQYWDDIVGLVDGVSSEQKDLLETTQKTLDVQEQQLKSTGQMENTLKLQGKSEKEIRDLKKQQTDEIILSTELLLEQQKSQKKAQVEAAERNQKITQGIIAFLTAPLTILLGTIDGITNSLASLGIIDEATTLTEDYLNFTSSLLFDPESVAEAGDETINETENKLRQLKNTRDGYALQDKADAKKSSDEKAQDEIDAEKAKAAALESIRKALIDTEAEERAEKLRKIKEDFDKQIALAEEYYGKESEQVLALRAAQKSALDTQEAEFKEQDKEKQLKIDEEEKKKREKKLEEEKKYNQELADAEVGLQEAKVNAVKGGLSILGKLAGKNKALSAGLLIVEKGLAIAEVVTNTAKAIAAAKANLAATPAVIGVAPNPMFAIQAAATAKSIITSKIAAATSIATIAAQAIPGVGGGGGGRGSSNIPTGGGGAESLPPAFNIVGASGTNQLADAIGGQTQQPTKAYVVASDVSTAQEMDRNIIEGASIG